MRRVLNVLRCVDEEVLTGKGRLAADISGVDQLVLIDLVVACSFEGWTSSYLCALLSCCILQARSAVKIENGCFSSVALFIPLRSHSNHIVHVQRVCGFYVVRRCACIFFGVGIARAIGNWCCGTGIEMIMRDSGGCAGTLFRAIMRLQEILKQIFMSFRCHGG